MIPNQQQPNLSSQILLDADDDITTDHYLRFTNLLANPSKTLGKRTFSQQESLDSNNEDGQPKVCKKRGQKAVKA